MGKKKEDALKKRFHSKEDEKVINQAQKEDWKQDKSYPSKANVLRELIPVVLIGIVLYFAYPYIKQAHKTAKQGTEMIPENKSQVGKLTIFQPEELLPFNGIDRPRIYLAYLGEVFDVTAGDKHYGKGGGYHFFAGKDASRAFVTGQFDEEGLIEGVEDFDLEQIGGLLNWYKFYRSHEEYFKVGLLVGAFYNDQGKQTKALHKVKRRFNDYDAWTKEQTEMKQKYPDCNMQSWENKDAEVWCDRGVPRRVKFGQDKGVDKARCGCYPEEEIQIAEPQDALLYPNCEKLSRKCRYQIKEMEQRIIDAFPDSAEAQQMLGLRKRTAPVPIL